MPKLNALEELHIALDLVAREEPAMSVRETAERFLRDERAAIEPFADAWLIKEIAGVTFLGEEEDGNANS